MSEHSEAKKWTRHRKIGMLGRTRHRKIGMLGRTVDTDELMMTVIIVIVPEALSKSWNQSDTTSGCSFPWSHYVQWLDTSARPSKGWL